MSIQALAWAFDQTMGSSSKKSVLVALANYASETGKSYPCVETVCVLTELHEDTVRACLKSLVSDSVVRDTGKRVGSTQQVKVYQLPREACCKTPELPGLKDSEKPRERLGKAPGFSGAEPGTSNHKPSTDKSTKFVVPTFPELELYAQKIGLPPTEIDKFFNYHESKGWKVGNAPMKNWQAAMRTWRTNYEERRFVNGHGNGQVGSSGVRENPRNAGIARGPTDYAKLGEKFASRTAEAARVLDQSVAADAGNPPAGASDAGGSL